MADKAPPGRLRILGRDLTVNLKAPEALPDRYGQFDADTLAIDIRTGLDTFDLKDTLVHEVFHAIRFGQGREYGGPVEEDYVRSLATGLIGVLQDNPELAKWLLHTPKKPISK